MPAKRTFRGYELIEPLGRSAERTTWRARRTADGAEVAIKELLFHAMESWKTEELFEREARVLEQLDHPAIPRLLEAFAVRDGARGGLYLVRELVRGRSLEEEMRARAHAPREAAAIAAELCAIAGDLHALTPPIVHRDLTLANVIRREDGRLIAIDLGAVKDTLAPHGSTVAGTYGFMAPEQLRGEACPASDVYAIGAIAVSLIARRPIADLLDVRHRLRLEEHVPRGPLRRALGAMLSPSARSRPSARAAERELREVARGGGSSRGLAVSGVVAMAIAGVIATAVHGSGPHAEASEGPVPVVAGEPAHAAPEPVAPAPAPPIPSIPPSEEPREPPALEGWTPRCAPRDCVSVEASFAGISLDDACGPLVPAEGETPVRSERAEPITVELASRQFGCRAEQQLGAFCNVVCEMATEDAWGRADELRAWIGDRHGLPGDADEQVSGRSAAVAGLPPTETVRRSWTWASGDTFAPTVLLLAERTTGVVAPGRVTVSYRGRFQARRPR